MASIRKITSKRTGKAIYQVKHRTPDGKMRTKGGFATRKAAEQYATSATYTTHRGQTYDPKSGGATFRDVAEAWLVSRVDLKPRTRQGYAYILNAGADLDRTFGSYPLNKITRVLVTEWIARRAAEGKRPSTVRHQYFILKQVLDQAIADGRLSSNPCEHVALPNERTAAASKTLSVDDVVDPAQFLTAGQVAALVDSTPWPYNVTVHVAAWTGLRAAELAGLQIGDLELPPENRPNAPGAVHVRRTVLVKYGPLADGARKPGRRAGELQPEIVYDTPKTRGSRRRVPLTPATCVVLRDYLATHPRVHELDAPLFPACSLRAIKPTGKTAPTHPDGLRMSPAEQAATATVQQAEARLILDWTVPLVHRNFYGAVYRPAVLRANLNGAKLLPSFRFHSLRHTYASLCIAAGIAPFKLSKFMGHANTNVTLGVYSHLFEDDHTDAMAALGAMGQPTLADNVVPMRVG